MAVWSGLKAAVRNVRCVDKVIGDDPLLYKLEREMSANMASVSELRNLWRADTDRAEHSLSPQYPYAQTMLREVMGLFEGRMHPAIEVGCLAFLALGGAPDTLLQLRMTRRQAAKSILRLDQSVVQAMMGV